MSYASSSYSFIQSPLGILKIGDTNGLIHEVTFIDSNEPLVKLNIKAHLQCIQELEEYFSGNRKVFDFPMQQSGTPFQQSVWKELMNIPYGETISYLELSKRIGDPKAIRAVGTANGRNNIAIIVPCHRVIGSNNKLTGYAGGLWRKEWLLKHELKYSGVKKGMLF